MKKQSNTSPTSSLTYAQAIDELNHIVEQLQNPQCEIDSLYDYTKRAKELLQFCKVRLKETDEEVKKLLNEPDEE